MIAMATSIVKMTEIGKHLIPTIQITQIFIIISYNMQDAWGGESGEQGIKGILEIVPRHGPLSMAH